MALLITMILVVLVYMTAWTLSRPVESPPQNGIEHQRPPKVLGL